MSLQIKISDGRWQMAGGARFFRHLSSVICILLTACAFEPMYGKHSDAGIAPVGALTERIDVQVKADDPARRRYAEQFKSDLENRLNPSGGSTQAAYALNVQLKTQEQAVGISRDGTVSRYNVILIAQLALSRMHDGAMVYTRELKRTSSYNNVSNAFYSTYVSGQDASMRAITALAEDAQLALAGFFAAHPVPQALENQQVPEVKPVLAPGQVFDDTDRWRNP